MAGHPPLTLTDRLWLVETWRVEPLVKPLEEMMVGKVMDLSKCGGICRGACKHYEIGVECSPEATYEPKEVKKTTLAGVKDWMQITEGKGGIGRRDLMEWLITEVERLNNERTADLAAYDNTIQTINKAHAADVERMTAALYHIAGCPDCDFSARMANKMRERARMALAEEVRG